MNVAAVVWRSLFKVLNDLYHKMKFTLIVMTVLVMFVVFIYARPQKLSNSTAEFPDKGHHYGHQNHGANCFYGKRGPPPRPTATPSTTTMATTKRTTTTTTTTTTAATTTEAEATEAPTDTEAPPEASPEEPSEGSPETAET